jgi:hypothetical protein
MIISRLDTPAVMCDKLGSIYEEFPFADHHDD